MYIVDSAVPACRRRPGRRNTGLRTAATTCRGGGNVRLYHSLVAPRAEVRALRCALACCRYFASKGPIGDSIFLALIVDAAHLLPLFAEMGLMGPIGDSIFVALIVDGGVLLPLFAEMRRGCRGAASGVISWIFWTSWWAWRFHRGRGVHRRLALCLGMPCRGSWGVPFRLS